MAWLLSGQLQSSLGSLKNQVANSLKEVFEAVDEDDDPQLDDPNQDPNEKVELAKGRIRELKTLLESRIADIDQLKKQNESLQHLKKVPKIHNDINIETRMTHMKNLAKAIESYRASVGKSWKVSLRANWKFDNFDQIHAPYVKYLKAIGNAGGSQFVVSILSTTTQKQIVSKAKNSFLSNGNFYRDLIE